MGFNDHTEKALAAISAPPADKLALAHTIARNQAKYHVDTYNDEINVLFRQTLIDTANYLRTNNVPTQNHTLAVPGGRIGHRWSTGSGDRTLGFDQHGWALRAPESAIFHSTDLYQSVRTPNTAFLREDGLALSFKDAGRLLVLPVSDGAIQISEESAHSAEVAKGAELIEFKNQLYAVHAFNKWYDRGWLRHIDSDDFLVDGDELNFTEEISGYDRETTRVRSLAEYMAVLAVQTVVNYKNQL